MAGQGGATNYNPAGCAPPVMSQYYDYWGTPAKKTRAGHPLFYELGEDENKLYEAKHRMYATDADPMSNFRLCGDLIHKLLKPGVDPTIASALCLLSKQIVGVYEIIGEGKTDTIESLEDKLKDIGIYARILRILVRESQKTTSGPTIGS